MTDNITLPRADALHIREVLLVWRRFAIPEDIAALAALEAALAEPEQKSVFEVDAKRYRWLRGEGGGKGCNQRAGSHRRDQGGEAVSNRELLELAAKAAGIRINYWESGGIWNPLTDDGDALRLMVKLHMCVTSFSDEQMVGYVKNGVGYNVSEAHGLDAYAATRRAIVRAAAEIGRNMP